MGIVDIDRCAGAGDGGAFQPPADRLEPGSPLYNVPLALRVTGALEATQVDSIPVAAPTEEERAQPYLWRFWRHLPRRGRFALFDRSWYGRVLVERVEGFCAEADWLRAYSEINDFEHDIADAGVAKARKLAQRHGVLVNFAVADCDALVVLAPGFAVQEGAQVLVGKAHFVVVSAQALACSAARAFFISSSQ